eukprot:Gb_27778 [translate_table: standard]
MRLNTVLSLFIFPKQFGFLEGRLIHEAIGTAQEGFHTIKNSHAPAAIIKLVLSKSFDRVAVSSWDLTLLSVQLGVDAIMGYGQNIFLPEDLVLQLQFWGKCTLDKIDSPLDTTLWRQGGFYLVKMGYLTLQAPTVKVESWWLTKLWKVWKDLEQHLGLQDLCKKGTLDENFHEWFTKRELRSYRVTPYLVLWGIWLAKNSIIF